MLEEYFFWDTYKNSIKQLSNFHDNYSDTIRVTSNCDLSFCPHVESLGQYRNKMFGFIKTLYAHAQQVLLYLDVGVCMSVC